MIRKQLIIKLKSKSSKEFYQSRLDINKKGDNPWDRTWDWDEDTLTLSPSVLSVDGMFHYFLKNGKIENCGDAIVNDLELKYITVCELEKHKSGNGWTVIKSTILELK